MEIWDEIGILEPTEEDPKKVIISLMAALEHATAHKLYSEISSAGFFPEEVTYSSSLDASSLISNIGGIAAGLSAALSSSQIKTIENPHPDFGYNPIEAKMNKWFRYRVLIKSLQNSKINYELFKFKYSPTLYPVIVYASSKDFDKLTALGDKNELKIWNRAELEETVVNIISSKSTIELFKRLLAIIE